MFALAMPLAGAGAAQASVLTVGTTADSGATSLRNTIAAANPGDTVLLPASAVRYQVSAGEIPITKAPLTIQGAGASSSVVDASGSSRVFHVTAAPPSSATVTFQGVTITGGETTSMPGGGGVLVNFVSSTIAVNLAFVDAAVNNNFAIVSTGDNVCCGGGGGIYSNGGSIALTRSQVNNNIANVTGSMATTSPGANDDGGGGIHQNYAAGAITLDASAVSGNSSTVSGGYCCHGGGGIYDDAGTGVPLTISNHSQLSSNQFTLTGNPADMTASADNCCSGGGAIYQDSRSTTSIADTTMSGNSSTVSSGNCCHGGGAVYNDATQSLSIQRSGLSNNTSTVTGPPGATFGNDHCCSGGGAIASFRAVNLDSSTLDGNTSTVNAGDCCHGGGAVQFDSSESITSLASTISNNHSTVAAAATESGGGGVYEDTGSGVKNSYTNSTISGNSTNGSGSQSGGGGLYMLNGSGTIPDVLANATIAGNSASAGIGGGVINAGSKVSTKNSILALNSAAGGNNCAGFTPSGGVAPVLISLGYNLEDSPSTCGFTGTGDKVVAASSVGLGPLASNGGPTLTRALLSGSAAIDAGNPAGCTDPLGALLSVDQRGFRRPSGGRCDIGAFELQFAAPKCTLKAKSNKVLVKKPKKHKGHKSNVGVLTLTASCDQAASTTLTGTLTEVLRKGKHGKKHKRKIKLRAVVKQLAAGVATTLDVKLPRTALNALKHKTRESVTVTLSATNANGPSSVKLTLGRLKPRLR